MKKKFLITAVVLTLIFGCMNLYAEESMKEVINNGEKIDGVKVTNKNAEPTEKVEIENSIIKANNKLSFDLLSSINNEDELKNVLISPNSILNALAMCYVGAEGNTKKEFENFFGYNNLDRTNILNALKNLNQKIHKGAKGMRTTMANSMWISENLKVKDNFINNNKDIFGSEVRNVNLPASVDVINEWMSAKTSGKITNLLNKDDLKNAVMTLVNTLYFDTGWAESFDISNTKKDIFTNANNEEKSVDMMYKKVKDNPEAIHYYGKFDNCQVVKIPYLDNSSYMYIILPEKDLDINAFTNSINVDRFNEMKKSLTFAEGINLYMPKFKLDYGTKDLKTSLENLGLKESFTSKANFSGITDGELYIDKALHKTFIDVYEAGTEAAAATVITTERSSSAISPTTMKINRPFLSIIEDGKTGSILFMGKIYDLGQ